MRWRVYRNRPNRMGVRKMKKLSSAESTEGLKNRRKRIDKSWAGFRAGAKAVFTDALLVVQCLVLAALYAFFAYKFPVFFYVSLGLTACTAVYIFISGYDAQIKASWLLLMILSCGFGYIIYFLANKRVCYGYDRQRFCLIVERAKPFQGEFKIENATAAVENDCKYLYNAGGFIPYNGTHLKYFSGARGFFEDLLERLERAEKFVLIEFFIVADGVLFEKFLNVFKRKTAVGVEIKILCDDAGCQGVFSVRAKKQLKEAGVKLKMFSQMLAPFNFGLNFRDHRKIVIIDGKTGYICGCNISDDCINERKLDGFWKDAGVRIDGAAVDGLTHTFLRQWEFSTDEKIEFCKYLKQYDKTTDLSTVVPYAGGPELKEALCRGLYANMISGAREKLYFMSPYFVPDGEILSQLKAKALSGVDVRLVLPEVPDYNFIYRITKSNADRLIKYGVKVYYVRDTFVHSKVCLTENCVSVGSVNLDMRAFYQEFDNGVYTDDSDFMCAVASDFEEVFASDQPAVSKKENLFSAAICAVLRIFSPLM